MAKHERLPNNTDAVKAKQDEMYAAANPALKDKIGWVSKWYREDAKYSLMSRWEIGFQVAELLKDRDNNGCKTFGANAFAAISAFAGEAEGSLRIYARLYSLYSKAQMTDIAEMRMADGRTPLSFSHVRAVISIEDEHDRQKAINLALENSWTAEQLGKYVLKYNKANLKPGEKGKGYQGMTNPKGLKGVVQQQLSFADDFEKRNMAVWSDPEMSVTGQMADMEEDQYTDEMADQLLELAKKMRKLANEAVKRADEAEEHYQQIKKALDKKLKKVRIGSNDDGDNSENDGLSNKIVGRQRKVVAA